jgi:hypothetical protein
MSNRSFRLSIQQSIQGKVLDVIMAGFLNEKSTYPEIPAGEIESMRVELREIRSINSSGLKSWITWLRNFNAGHPGVRINLMNVSSVMIQNLRIFREILNKLVVVDSVEVPYYCQNCKAEPIRVVLRNEGSQGISNFIHALSVDARPCTCGNSQLILDIEPTTYFWFWQMENEQT